MACDHRALRSSAVARDAPTPRTRDLRIGISTGPVVSGVIGRRKYSFDVWGDTVNLASRMESAGVAGRIQVSEGTYWRLQHAFELETRGVIALKGREDTPACLLVGRTQPGAVPSAVGA